MGSKLILLLWLLIGSLLTFFCINKDKGQELLNRSELLLNIKNSYFKEESNIKSNSNLMKDELPTQLSTSSLPTSIPQQKDLEKSNEVVNQMESKSKKLNEDTYIVKKIEKVENIVSETLKDNPIFFEKGSDKIREDSQEGLAKVLKILKSLPKGTVVKIEGYTDAVGDSSFNKKLSQKRANLVKNYLKQSGLNHLKIDAKGYGEGKPLLDNPNDIKNRRVEIHLIRGE